MTRWMLLPAVATVWVLACSTSSESTVASDSGTKATCELHDGGCDPGCCAQQGVRYDPTRGCLTGGSIVIGCAPKSASTECGYLGVVGCAITPAGTFLTYDRLAPWTAPTACPDPDKVITAKPCSS